jgi:bifunctional non-homologous end joining protein LigD
MMAVFDVLHLDGRTVRALPYWRRRELLSELALDGPAWCTPRYFVADAEAVVRATAAQDLEGVVAKRLDARYADGRRSGAWIKQKHRRRERLVITGWRERSGSLAEFFLARQDSTGALWPVGSASLGLDAERRAQLIDALSPRGEIASRRRRGGIRPAGAPVEVVADYHGPAAGPLRDTVIREIVLPELASPSHL